MKHTLKITLILVVLFFFTQLVGLSVISQYVTIEEKIEVQEVFEDGELIQKEVVVQERVWSNLPYDIERPELREEKSYVPIILSIMAATLLALLLIRLEAKILWKIWFFLSVLFTLAIAFNAFIIQNLAILLALGFAYLKTFKRNVYVHNFTELFIYGGLSVIFVPILNVISVFVLLIVISIYDMYAVWKSKHMIRMAKFQTKLRLFAGLLIPYGKNKTAILGGGDLGFPLLFTGVMFKFFGWKALIVILTTSLALWMLLVKSQKNRFYPAMPFISLGCLLGYVLLLLI